MRNKKITIIIREDKIYIANISPGLTLIDYCESVMLIAQQGMKEVPEEGAATMLGALVTSVLKGYAETIKEGSWEREQ